jgi:hypothetical protein
MNMHDLMPTRQHFDSSNLIPSENSTGRLLVAIESGNIKIHNFSFIIPPPQSHLLFPERIFLEFGHFSFIEGATLIFERVLASLR